MNAVEIYTLEVQDLFQKATQIIKAADAEKSLNESERHIIKLMLHQVRSKLADVIFDLTHLCENYDEICDTLQLSMSRN